MATVKKVKIKKINVVKNADVYDITVKDNNNFFANGILVHNCGEQGLPISGSCNLGAINLVKYVREDKKGFDYEKLAKDLPTVLRFQDSVIDITNYPLKEQKTEALQKRRCGIGYMGYASALYLMKISYGSKKALKMTEELCSFVTNTLYRASADLAVERGVFPAFDKDQYLKSKFVEQALDEGTIAKIKKCGLRNSHLTTVAPTGNTSIFANNVSGGLEPIISPKSTRTVIESNAPEGLEIPKHINWDKHTFEAENNGWSWILEGDEWILRKEFNNVVYKIDHNRGLCREEEMFDYAVFLMGEEFWREKQEYETEKKDFYGKTIYNLSLQEHLETMAIFAQYVDSSISKTINIPNNFPFEDFKQVYQWAYDTKYIKGITTYREGTMANVVSAAPSAEMGIVEHQAPKRPKTLPCHVYRIKVRDENWIIFVGIYKGHPFEVFAGKVGLVDLPSNISEGSTIKVKSGLYQFEHNGDVLIKDIRKIFESGMQESLTRQISTNLRHGTPIQYVFEQLGKAYGEAEDFNKSILKALKRYMKEKDEVDVCPNCNINMIRMGTCEKCPICGYSIKCGI